MELQTSEKSTLNYPVIVQQELKQRKFNSFKLQIRELSDR